MEVFLSLCHGEEHRSASRTMTTTTTLQPDQTYFTVTLFAKFRGISGSRPR